MLFPTHLSLPRHIQQEFLLWHCRVKQWIKFCGAFLFYRNCCSFLWSGNKPHLHTSPQLKYPTRAHYYNDNPVLLEIMDIWIWTHLVWSSALTHLKLEYAKCIFRNFECCWQVQTILIIICTLSILAHNTFSTQMQTPWSSVPYASLLGLPFFTGLMID